MKKILFVLHYPPPVHGAAIMGGFIKECARLNQKYDCSYINLGTSASVDEIGKKGTAKFKRYFEIFKSVRTYMKISKPDLVYLSISATGLGFYKDGIIALLVKSFGSKVIYHFHNKGVSSRHHKWFDNTLYRYVFKNAFVILLSKHLFYDVSKYVQEDQVSYCANGIMDLAKNWNSSSVINQKVQVLFLSNLLVNKGIEVLLEACKILKSKSLNFTCVIVGGEGDLTTKDLKKLIITNQIEDVVHYGGKKYGEEKKMIYAQSDIFAFPTLDETFGLVNLEAMQFCLPVVATIEGGIPDIIEDNVSGFLIPKNNAEKLAEKIEILINNPSLRSQMGKKGREIYEKKFTKEIFEDRFLEIIKKMM